MRFPTQVSDELIGGPFILLSEFCFLTILLAWAVNLLNRWESSRHTPCAVASKTKGFCIADGTWNVPATPSAKQAGFAPHDLVS